MQAVSKPVKTKYISGSNLRNHNIKSYKNLCNRTPEQIKVNIVLPTLLYKWIELMSSVFCCYQYAPSLIVIVSHGLLLRE